MDWIPAYAGKAVFGSFLSDKFRVANGSNTTPLKLPYWRALWSI
jgi:hypothetical protein